MRDVVSTELLSVLVQTERLKGQGYMIMFISAFFATLSYSIFPFLNEFWWSRVIIGLLSGVAAFCISALFFTVWLVEWRTSRALTRLEPSTKDIEKLLSTGVIFSSEQHRSFERYLKTLNC
ncbi:hypothetical protein P3450_21115 [Vibrio parahaemolyticus]|nr:hypothetical protein [Vibrio toranzoniae]MDF4484995.1 hypothetical protein [Vibrio parahaemolyticus]MDF4509016.1 hypothetical protein [Vibrio parahaemolyticus]MDF4531444.1 hypothetical protein [Vibrio parahaemolyticus]MDG3369349.1 hypothetical protein [Vibrio parahaemolyticus]MDG3373994.1 hypothetical protein [Vibrio parahaemolyticus]